MSITLRTWPVATSSNVVSPPPPGPTPNGPSISTEPSAENSYSKSSVLETTRPMGWPVHRSVCPDEVDLDLVVPGPEGADGTGSIEGVVSAEGEPFDGLTNQGLDRPAAVGAELRRDAGRDRRPEAAFDLAGGGLDEPQPETEVGVGDPVAALGRRVGGEGQSGLTIRLADSTVSGPLAPVRLFDFTPVPLLMPEFVLSPAPITDRTLRAPAWPAAPRPRCGTRSSPGRRPGPRARRRGSPRGSSAKEVTSAEIRRSRGRRRSPRRRLGPTAGRPRVD